MLKGFFPISKKRNHRFLISALLICFLTVMIYASANICWFSATIHSAGVVKTLGVGVYWDEACNEPVSYLDWGILEEGIWKNVTVYVRNEGNVFGYVSLSAVNWDPPSASNYMTLSWDYSGRVLKPNEIIETALILSISYSIQNITDFMVDIVISAIE